MAPNLVGPSTDRLARLRRLLQGEYHLKNVQALLGKEEDARAIRDEALEEFINKFRDQNLTDIRAAWGFDEQNITKRTTKNPLNQDDSLLNPNTNKGAVPKRGVNKFARVTLETGEQIEMPVEVMKFRRASNPEEPENAIVHELIENQTTRILIVNSTPYNQRVAEPGNLDESMNQIQALAAQQRELIRKCEELRTLNNHLSTRNAQLEASIRGNNNPQPRRTPFNGRSENKPRDVAKLVASWDFKFSEDGEGLSIDQFLSQVQEYRITAALTDEELLRSLPLLLKEPVLDVLCVNQKKWTQFETDMRNQFGSEGYHEEFEGKIRERKQKPNETMNNYLNAMLAMFKKLPEPWIDQKKINPRSIGQVYEAGKRLNEKSANAAVLKPNVDKTYNNGVMANTQKKSETSINTVEVPTINEVTKFISKELTKFRESIKATVANQISLKSSQNSNGLNNNSNQQGDGQSSNQNNSQNFGNNSIEDEIITTADTIIIITTTTQIEMIPTTTIIGEITGMIKTRKLIEEVLTIEADIKTSAIEAVLTIIEERADIA
ncbi:hypothetical protein TSAR_006282 [Trichomalopsis sarcophagae]|uniref:Retrotransposon gag domain-containing protein n=1 Tax=Trichomalopsis sarcophagae TaxID=543379 RepID=A0A232EM92_9HYME|nr:hypothetical protein TSAR_006282 [Trichomalopsis sarcophagae]